MHGTARVVCTAVCSELRGIYGIPVHRCGINRIIWPYRTRTPRAPRTPRTPRAVPWIIPWAIPRTVPGTIEWIIPIPSEIQIPRAMTEACPPPSVPTRFPRTTISVIDIYVDILAGQIDFKRITILPRNLAGGHFSKILLGIQMNLLNCPGLPAIHTVLKLLRIL